jgi:hypothetical protein
MEVRVKFSADLVIDGKDLAEIKEKWESMPLFSEEAMDYSAEFSEVLLVEEYPSYKDISEEWENAYTDSKPYDSKGIEICVGDIVEIRGERYEVAEEPSDSGIGSTGLPLVVTSWVSGTTPCKIVGHRGTQGTFTPKEYVDYLYYIYRTNGKDREYTDLYTLARGNSQMLSNKYILDEALVDDIVLTLQDKINGNR